jgi:hydroxymethylglutaryl-CoA lyase
MDLRDTVRIVEVGPRDGLQNEAISIDTNTKIELIERLVDAGLKDIEATSFVSPKWVPQMADHSEVMARLRHKPGVTYPVLVPNMKGFEAAIANGASDISIFAAASETFSQRNTNCSIAESLRRFEPILEAAPHHGVRVRGYVSCVVGCPYEGPINPKQVSDVASQLFGLGCYEISLGDTVGVGTPHSVTTMLEAVSGQVPIAHLAGHFHDTYGMAIANVHASYQFGVRVFDASVSGLGGCPYAVGASGNVSTEDVVFLMHGLGVTTGINLDSLVETSFWISSVLGRQPASKVAKAMIAKCDIRPVLS